MLFDKEYVADPAISQSDLSLFERDIRQFYYEKILGEVKKDYSSTSMDIGSIIDAKILKPEELKNYYVVTDLKAKGKVKDVVDAVYISISLENPNMQIQDFPVWTWDDVDLIGQTMLQTHIEKAIKQVDYQNNWPMKTRFDKIVELGAGYYSQVIEADGRTTVNLKEWNKAHAKVQEIEEDEHSKAFFDMLFKEREGLIIHRQRDLYGEFEGTKLKGRLDLFFEDTINMRVSPWDAKTTGSHNLFMRNYRQKKYGRQGALYSELVRQNFPGYTIDPFRFLVIPIESEEKPEQYEMDPTEMYINTNGYTYESGFHIKGWQELVRDVAWHTATGKWDHRRDYYKSGKNLINSNAIISNELLEVREESKLF